MTSSASRRRPTIHADASTCLQGAPRALCHVFNKGQLDYPGHLTAPRTPNPHNVTCKACNAVLRERGQLFAIMLGNATRCESKAICMDGAAPHEERCVHRRGHGGPCHCDHGFIMREEPLAREKGA